MDDFATRTIPTTGTTRSSAKRVRIVTTLTQHGALPQPFFLDTTLIKVVLVVSSLRPAPSTSVGRPSRRERVEAYRRAERDHQVSNPSPAPTSLLVLTSAPLPSPLLKRLIFATIVIVQREDDTNWPKKNIVGKQELEIRIGNDHIAFEVSAFLRLRSPKGFSPSSPFFFAFIDREGWLVGRHPG